jgi:hypothetical protein
LICLQIAYPIIYGIIQKEPNFTEWDDSIVIEILKQKKIDTSELELLENSDEFDDEWEQNLWKICQINTFLRQRVFAISRLLNLIRENAQKIENGNSGEVIDKLLRMSSVTNISSDISMDSGSRSPKKRYFFTNAIEPFIEEQLMKEFPDYWKLPNSHPPRVTARKDSGALVLPIKTDILDCDLVIRTDYERINVYVNNHTAYAGQRRKTIDWFEKHLREAFPTMKFNDVSRTKKRIVVLGVSKKEDGLSREEILERYKQITLQIYRKVLPVLEANG